MYPNLNMLLTVWTCPHKSWSENTLLNNGMLRFFNEDLWFCSFFLLLQKMVVHLPVEQLFTHLKFLRIFAEFCILCFLNPCPTRLNDCLGKDYVYLCFPTIYYSRPPNSAGTFMWILSYKSCPSPLIDSKGKKRTTITHRTEQNRTVLQDRNDSLELLPTLCEDKEGEP